MPNNRPTSVNELPRFEGLCTFLRLPYAQDPTGLDVGIIGVPYDMGQYSTASGARFGPRAIREGSSRPRLHHQTLEITPYDWLNAADVGDVPINPMRLEASLQAITDHVGRVVQAGAIPLCVGGDHTISLPILRAVSRRHKPVALVHFDAHSDTADDDLGVREGGHGTPFRRALEEGLIDPARSLQIGLRSWEGSDELAFARDAGMELITLDMIDENGVKWVADQYRRIGGAPVFVSIDLDVLDPAFAPAVSPNPGGLTSRELMYMVRKLAGQTVVGGDIVELDAHYDLQMKPTAVLAAYLLYDLLCVCAWSRRAAKASLPEGT
jgi:guanidinopropionase